MVWHVENGPLCTFPNDKPVSDGSVTVDPVTSVRTTIANPVGTGIPTKQNAANTISEVYSLGQNSLTVDVEQYCDAANHFKGTSKIHIEFTQGIGDAEMIAYVNGLLNSCSFSDLVPNSPASSGIFKQRLPPCDRLAHGPVAGCPTRLLNSDTSPGIDLLTTGEAAWAVDQGILGECVSYFANKLLIKHGNAKVCLARFNHFDNSWSNFAEVDASDYFEVGPPAPELSLLHNNWVANKGYRDPFAIFPPTTTCP